MVARQQTIRKAKKEGVERNQVQKERQQEKEREIMGKLKKIEKIKAEYSESLRAYQAGQKSPADHQKTGEYCLATLVRMGASSRRAAWEILLPADDYDYKWVLKKILETD